MTYEIAGALASGVVVGMALHYIAVYKPLFLYHQELIKVIYNMKRQGFVPQFELEQPKPIDLTQIEF